ncbi:hypothetical protein Airi02_101600 [Actinoallomurus iriomotensis]|uniref:Uncharacterized protein n=1 Tax=Actinoallomurus iriomotensis TaxID=478107 RepID=A0A9W6SHD4_9ACTN|nr:hypothetical protein Airi02_101600 [Actinoallomurus iriomotensis]
MRIAGSRPMVTEIGHGRPAASARRRNSSMCRPGAKKIEIPSQVVCQEVVHQADDVGSRRPQIRDRRSVGALGGHGRSLPVPREGGETGPTLDLRRRPQGRSQLVAQ